MLMVRALMEAATTQDYFPEWFNTGVLYSDLTLFAVDLSARAVGVTCSG